MKKSLFFTTLSLIVSINTVSAHTQPVVIPLPYAKVAGADGQVQYNDEGKSAGSGIYYLKATGNVGVGNAYPRETLDVNGNVKANSFIGDGSQLTGLGAAESDPTVPAGIKDGISWTEVSNRPAGLDDGDDNTQLSETEVDNYVSNNGYLTSETDPEVGANATNYVPKWDGNALVQGAMYDDGTNIGVGTTTPTAKLEVNGQIKITGGSPGPNKHLVSDTEGLASWQTLLKPVAAYSGGDSTVDVTKNYGTYQSIKYVDITVPAGGIILLSATGYVHFTGTGQDYLLASILSNGDGDPNSVWEAENKWYGGLTVVSDYNNPGTGDQCYASFSNQRGFTVSSGGTFRFTLWANKYSTSSVTQIDDVTMFAQYYPN